MRSRLTAQNGWLAVGSLILAFELACPRGCTLSEGVDLWIEKHPVRTRLLVLLVAGHLINAIPPRYDVIHQLALLVKRF